MRSTKKNAFFNYKETNWLHSKHQKLEELKFEDEMGRRIIDSVLALKSKLYSISMGEEQKLPAKEQLNMRRKV